LYNQDVEILNIVSIVVRDNNPEESQDWKYHGSGKLPVGNKSWNSKKSRTARPARIRGVQELQEIWDLRNCKNSRLAELQELQDSLKCKCHRPIRRMPLRAGVTESSFSKPLGYDNSLDLGQSDADCYVFPPRE
jgi:hypothetical protein